MNMNAFGDKIHNIGVCMLVSADGYAQLIGESWTLKQVHENLMCDPIASNTVQVSISGENRPIFETRLRVYWSSGYVWQESANHL